METPTKDAFVRLVQKCLSQNSEGFIEREQFLKLCGELNLNDDEVKYVLNEMDFGNDGRIKVGDLTKGFEHVATLKFGEKTPDIRNGKILSSIDNSLYECQVNGLDSPLAAIGSSGYVN